MRNKLINFLCAIFLLLSTTVYAHRGNISSYKDKNSEKITQFNGEYYGFHKEDNKIHYHKVEWDEEKQRWQIKNISIYYDENFNIIKDNNAETKKVEVTLNRVIDGDTAVFDLIESEENITVRFLAINTPESTNEIEPYGKEAGIFTENKLTNAKKIILEYDNNSTETDKYNRHLAWIWIDDELLQSLLIENGLAKVDYIYGNYKYLEELKEKENISKLNKIGIWQEDIQDEVIDNTQSNTIEENNQNGNSLINIILIVVGIIVLWIGTAISKIKNRKISGG